MVKQRVLPISIWAVVLAMSAWVMLTKAHMSTDMAQFMPSAKTPVEKLLLEELNQGAASRLILLAISDPALQSPNSPTTDLALEKLAQFSRDFAEKLKQSGLFSRVDNGLRAKKDRKN